MVQNSSKLMYGKPGNSRYTLKQKLKKLLKLTRKRRKRKKKRKNKTRKCLLWY